MMQSLQSVSDMVTQEMLNCFNGSAELPEQLGPSGMMHGQIRLLMDLLQTKPTQLTSCFYVVYLLKLEALSPYVKQKTPRNFAPMQHLHEGEPKYSFSQK